MAYELYYGGADVAYSRLRDLGGFRLWLRLSDVDAAVIEGMRFWTLVAKRHPSFRFLYGDRLIDQPVIDDCTLLAQLNGCSCKKLLESCELAVDQLNDNY